MPAIIYNNLELIRHNLQTRHINLGEKKALISVSLFIIWFDAITLECVDIQLQFVVFFEKNYLFMYLEYFRIFSRTFERWVARKSELSLRIFTSVDFELYKLFIRVISWQTKCHYSRKYSKNIWKSYALMTPARNKFQKKKIPSQYWVVVLNFLSTK